MVIVLRCLKTDQIGERSAEHVAVLNAQLTRVAKIVWVSATNFLSRKVMQYMLRYLTLVLLTFTLGTVILFAVKFGFGNKSWLPERKEGSLRRDPIFWTKFKQINSLPPIGRKRPYTEQEMNLLRQAISDSNEYIRVEAIAALREAKHDPKQREEAIRLIVPYLKDPDWIVRIYAVRSMFWLEAKETIPYIIPLLNDPEPKVREAAKETLEKLGYKVRKGN